MKKVNRTVDGSVHVCHRSESLSLKRIPLTSVLSGLALSAFVCVHSHPASAQASQQALGIFEGQSDVGAVLDPGSATYHLSQKTYTLTGSGENMWMTKDAFHFLWKKS